MGRTLKAPAPYAWLFRMCNLYSLYSTREEIGKYLKVSHNRMGQFPEQLTMFPAREAPVVRLAEDLLLPRSAGVGRQRELWIGLLRLRFTGWASDNRLVQGATSAEGCVAPVGREPAGATFTTGIDYR